MCIGIQEYEKITAEITSFFAVSFDPSRVDAHDHNSLDQLELRVGIDPVHDGLGVVLMDVEPVLCQQLGHQHLRVGAVLEDDSVLEHERGLGHVLHCLADIVVRILVLGFPIVVLNFHLVLDHVLEHFGQVRDGHWLACHFVEAVGRPVQDIAAVHVQDLLHPWLVVHDHEIFLLLDPQRQVVLPGVVEQLLLGLRGPPHKLLGAVYVIAAH